MSSLLVQHRAAIRRRSSVTLVRQESMSLDKNERLTLVSSTYDSTLENLTREGKSFM